MANKHRVVFITNMGRDHNYSAAARFGALRPITRGNFPMFQTERLREEVVTALSSSTQEDYLVLSGQAFISGLCMLVWMEMHGRCKVLMHDKSNDSYVHRTLSRSDLRMQIEQARDVRGAPTG